MQGKLVFLGTGASTGTPMVGCKCAVCTSGSEKSRRLRPSVLIEMAGKKFVIDIGPDFRQQALKFNLLKCDGVLLTHYHFDHIAGVDELRVLNFNGGKKVPCLLSSETLHQLSLRCHYMMDADKEGRVDCKYLQFHLLESDFGTALFEGVNFTYFSYVQMGAKVTGFRVGNLAYVPDICSYSDEILNALEGVEILIVDALKEEKSRGHFSLNEAILFAQKIRAKKTYFTHIAHEMDTEKASKTLPQNMSFAFDGQELFFEV